MGHTESFTKVNKEIWAYVSRKTKKEIMFCGIFASKNKNMKSSHAVNIYAAIPEQPISVCGAERKRLYSYVKKEKSICPLCKESGNHR